MPGRKAVTNRYRQGDVVRLVRSRPTPGACPGRRDHGQRPRNARARVSYASALNATQTLCPPKPSELFKAAFTGVWRAVFGT